MSTRRGWQATMGELDAVLRHLDVAQGADAQVRDGQLWIRHTPTQPWVAAVRIPAALAALQHQRREGALIKTLMHDYRLSKASVYRYLASPHPGCSEPHKSRHPLVSLERECQEGE